jgi:hypothetical protein
MKNQTGSYENRVDEAEKDYYRAVDDADLVANAREKGVNELYRFVREWWDTNRKAYKTNGVDHLIEAIENEYPNIDY